ncbi:MAG: hypothetical protein ABEK29_11355 [Bradymonadaceae bacterium]
MLRSSVRIPRIAVAIGVCLVATGLAGPADATTMPYMTLPKLVDQSELIVRGTVADQRSFVDSDSGRITTHTSVDVEKVYAGSLDRDRVIVEKWGGRVGDRALSIPGSASYETGEQVLLFLEFNNGADDFPAYVVAGTQAKFHIADTDEGERISRSVSGVEFLDSDTPRGNLEQPVAFSSFESRLVSLIYTLKQGATGEN